MNDEVGAVDPHVTARRGIVWKDNTLGSVALSEGRIMRRLAVAAMLVLGALVFGAGAALAEPPAGSAATCPPRYQAMTLDALLAQAERLEVPEDRARNLFLRVNKNEDAWICQTKLPGDALSRNFIDNQAVGLDRP